VLFRSASKSSRHVGQSKRHFHQGSDGTIASREDFEAYEWCDPAAANLDLFDKARAHLPEGMGVLVGHSGMLENVMWLLGYENMSYFLYDDEDLVADMFEAVASRIVTAFDRCCAHDTVIGIQMGDDMGYKTATMFAPEVYRTHLFPWYRRLTKAVHDRGKFAILHTCGHVDEVMEDLIGCGWDAKHSFEDLIEPVWETKEKYGDRIALLGGFDMDKLSRMSVPEVRAHTRFLVERCAPGGGWALGSGNSVADYVSVDNYLAMLDEGRRCGGYAASAV
jgi:uroporphyrinogen decarboxylase